MKLLLVINVADDVAESYKNFTVDYDLRGEDEDGGNVSISYVEDVPLKPLPQKREPKEEWLNEYHRDEFADGWNACINDIDGTKGWWIKEE